MEEYILEECPICRGAGLLKEAGWNRTRAARPLVAMVTPLWAFTEWHRAVRNSTEALGGQVRFIAYASDTDPNISEAINENEYDVIFLSLPDREDSRLLELVSRENDRVVVMFRDMSMYGIRSLLGADPVYIERFLELLVERGHADPAGDEIAGFFLDRLERPLDAVKDIVENAGA